MAQDSTEGDKLRKTRLNVATIAWVTSMVNLVKDDFNNFFGIFDGKSTQIGIQVNFIFHQYIKWQMLI